ncbi:MAG: hypothetical protein ACI4OJ_01995 [Lachnospiraceae bacterium]
MAVGRKNADSRNPYRRIYEGYFIKRLRRGDLPALEALLGGGDEALALLSGAKVVVGIFDCRGRACRLSLYDPASPLAAAGAILSDGSFALYESREHEDSKQADLHFREVLRFVCERNLSQSGRGGDLPPDEEAFLTDAAYRARAIRGLTAIIATHDFVERVGTHYED